MVSVNFDVLGVDDDCDVLLLLCHCWHKNPYAPKTVGPWWSLQLNRRHLS